MKRKISIGLIVFIVLIVLFYLSLPLLVSNEKISTLIKQYAHEALGREFSFEAVKVGVFPRFSIEITKIDVPEIKKEITAQAAGHALTCSVKADSLRFSIKLLPLLFKEVSISSIAFKNVSVDGVLTAVHPNEVGAASLASAVASPGPTPTEKNVFFRFADINGKVSHLTLGKPIDYDIEGNFGNEISVCRSKGTFLLTRDDLVLRWSTSETTIENGDLELVRLLCGYFGYPLSFEQGTINGVIKVKQRGFSIATDSDLVVKELIYTETFAGKERRSIPFDAAFAGIAVVDLEKQAVRFENADVTLKDSKIRLSGDITGGDQPYWDLTLYSEKTSLDTLPLIFPALSENLPYNVGFSGTVVFDIVAKRTADNDSFVGNFDLGQAVLTFMDFFSKSQGLPTHVNAHFYSSDQTVYEGDATVLVGDMNLKATVTKFDLSRQKLEGSFLTNNFDINNWDNVVTLLKDRAPSGTIKVFGAGALDFKDLKASSYNGGIVLDTVSCVLDEDLALKNVVSSILIDNEKIFTDSLRFNVNDSRLDGSFRVSLKPTMAIDVLLAGNELDLSFCDKYFAYASPAEWRKDVQKKVIEASSKASAESEKANAGALAGTSSTSGPTPPSTESIQETLKKEMSQASQFVISFGNVYLLGNALKNVSVRVKEQSGLMVMEEGDFEIAEGKGTVQATFNVKSLLAPQAGDFGGKLTVRGLDINQLQGYLQEASAALGGRADIDVTLQGSGVGGDIARSLNGDGSVIITQGQFKKMDFMEILSKFDFLLNLGDKATGSTDFSRFEYIFKVFNARVDSDHIKLYSPLYDCDGMGTYAFDGGINYRINVVLNESLSRAFMTTSTVAGERFKIPVQIYNTVDDPKFSVERAVTADLINAAVNKGLDALFGNTKADTQKTPAATTSASGQNSPPIT
jgi:hypothetical protein